jgi:hypothetical protein
LCSSRKLIPQATLAKTSGKLRRISSGLEFNLQVALSIIIKLKLEL